MPGLWSSLRPRGSRRRLLIDLWCAGLGRHGDETGGGVWLGGDAETEAATRAAKLAFSLGPHAYHLHPSWVDAQKKTAHAAEQERDDVAAARAEWKNDQATLDLDKLVFVDETGAATNMARRNGRSPRGQRLVAAVPHGHWKTTTLVAALRQDRITAPMVIDQAMNGPIFKAWVEQCLAPTLGPGDIVTMDNLPAQKVKGVRDAIEARKAQLVYLPPYSPDFNPIEQVFAKLKALLRQAAERTVDGLWDRIGQLLHQFEASECKNYFTNAGYVQT